MKNPVPCATLLDAILRNEISVLAALYNCQKRMYECVLIRDWVALQKETHDSETLADTFLEFERNRIELLRDAVPGVEGTMDFYCITISFSEPDRSRINALFREMKKLLLLSKTENEVFNTYITNARTLVSGMLETVLPARRNKIYSRMGSIVSANVENLVVNRSF